MQHGEVLGIICGKDCRTSNKIPHPCQPNRSLHFLADVPHVLKNLKAALISHNITIPADLAAANNLPSTTVSVKPVEDLFNFQKDKELKLAPKLTEATLNPSHFEKMKVSHALNFFSNSVAAALRFLVDSEGRSPDVLTTAWFIDVCNRWFDLMSSRHPVMALSKVNLVQYHAAIKSLSDMIKIFKTIKIGNGSWKPVQTGVILSTQSILDLQEEMLARENKFLLTSRFTQDCLENLFSSVRLKNPVPSPVEFKYALRIITVSQFLKTPNAGNYQDDDNDFLADFSSDTPIVPELHDIPEVDLHIGQTAATMTKDEENSLYYLCGYCISRLKLNDKHCSSCLESIQSSTPSNLFLAKLTNYKEYTDGNLVHPTVMAFQYIKTAEMTFRQYSSDDIINMKNVKEYLTSAVNSTATCIFPECHNIKGKLLSRYLNVRLHIFCKKIRASVHEIIPQPIRLCTLPFK